MVLVDRSVVHRLLVRAIFFYVFFCFHSVDLGCDVCDVCVCEFICLFAFAFTASVSASVCVCVGRVVLVLNFAFTANLPEVRYTPATPTTVATAFCTQSDAMAVAEKASFQI